LAGRFEGAIITSLIDIAIRRPPVATDSVLVSVIVPLAPSEPEPDALLAQFPDAFEVLLARGGTRASSMNKAAARASGRHLWFVHADTMIEPGAVTALLDRLRQPNAALHYFDLRFDGGWPMRITEAGVWFRSRILGIPFGDQAFCLPAASFQALGCYDETVVYGEDHRLVRRARQAGLPVRPVGCTVSTSARKYQQDGWLRTTLLHLWLTARESLRRP
jgi:hypothetical protein